MSCLDLWFLTKFGQWEERSDDQRWRDSCPRSPGGIRAKFSWVGFNPPLRVTAPGSGYLQTDIFSGCWNCSSLSLLWLRCNNSRLLLLAWDTAAFLAGPPKLAQFSSLQSVMSDSLWPYGLQHARPPCPSPTLSLFKLMSIMSVMQSNHLILCHPLLLPPSIYPSNRVFSNESVLYIRWPKYWIFSQHQSFQWIFRIDFL